MKHFLSTIEDSARAACPSKALELHVLEQR